MKPKRDETLLHPQSECMEVKFTQYQRQTQRIVFSGHFQSHVISYTLVKNKKNTTPEGD